MSSMTPNEDFLKDNTAVNKPIDVPSEKPIPKMEKPVAKTKKAKVEKKDATWKDVKVKGNPNISQNKKDNSKTTTNKKVISQEQYDIEKAKYPEYFALSDYHKKCLIATNYWRVMNGMPIIEVPALYTYYHKYFDARCYDLAKDHQDRLKIISDNKISTVSLTIPKDSLVEGSVVQIEVIGEIKSECIEPKLEVNGIIESTENVVPEIVITEEQVDNIYKEAVDKFPTTMEKLDDKNDSDNQLSLF